MATLVITIDGPAASGKSTVAKLVAEQIRANFLDTGSMYRAVTLAAIMAGADMTNEQKLLAIIDHHEFRFEPQHGKMTIYIDGIDVTEKIRDTQLTNNVRYVASLPQMREKLVQMQRQFAAKEKKIVTEGRDQGTVAFPNADIKFYLTAEPAGRARRRQSELKAKGLDHTLEQIQRDIEKRDQSDENRTVGPLKPANDAIVIDTTNLNVEQVVEKILHCINEKCVGKD